MSSVTKETIPYDAQTESAPVPMGPASAAILAGGIGTAWYGLMVLLAAASKGMASLLTFYTPVGPLSGKTTVGVAGFLLAWLVLDSLWKDKDIKVSKVWPVTLALVAVGLLFTFPPFFEAFE
ncbi:MAG: hypothetical protein ACM3ZA_09000 [Bacillota bacterium]